MEQHIFGQTEPTVEGGRSKHKAYKQNSIKEGGPTIKNKSLAIDTTNQMRLEMINKKQLTFILRLVQLGNYPSSLFIAYRLENLEENLDRTLPMYNYISISLYVYN